MLAGRCADLVQLFQRDICLRQTFACNVVLTSLPPQHATEMYSFFVDKMGIKPNYNTVALRIRALGRIARYVEAEQLFWQWQVSLTNQACMHFKRLSNQGNIYFTCGKQN